MTGISTERRPRFEFSSGVDRHFLMVERSSEPHLPIMGIERSRKCRSRQQHRVRDVPAVPGVFAIAASRFAADRPPAPASRERRHGGRVQSTGTVIVYGGRAAHGRITDLAIGGLSLLLNA